MKINIHKIIQQHCIICTVINLTESGICFIIKPNVYDKGIITIHNFLSVLSDNHGTIKKPEYQVKIHI